MSASPDGTLREDGDADKAALRRQLLAQRLARARANDGAGWPGAGQPAFEDAADVGSAPLSHSQEALWFLDQLTGSNGAWNIALQARLGGVHPETLQRSLQALIERHDPLRTAFVDEEGEPRQRVVPDATIALPIEDLRGLPDDAREEELARRMRARALEPFDLSRAQIGRAHV